MFEAMDGDVNCTCAMKAQSNGGKKNPQTTWAAIQILSTKDTVDEGKIVAVG